MKQRVTITIGLNQDGTPVRQIDNPSGAVLPIGVHFRATTDSIEQVCKLFMQDGWQCGACEETGVFIFET